MSVETILNAFAKVKEQKPLVSNITNFVVMNTTANALLAIGASPIMAHSQQEMGEIMRFAGALVINIGTLDTTWIPKMQFAIEQANKYNKPIVLDPVGCGATQLRTNLAKELSALANHVTIRGNASEIIALAGSQSQGKGVDSLDSSDTAVQAAYALVETYHANVVVSGATDHVISKSQHFTLHNGSSLMPYVTGTGCSLSALTGAFAAVGEPTGLAATAVMGVAGEIATKHSSGPGSLQVNLLDTLYNLNQQTLIQHLALRKV